MENQKKKPHDNDDYVKTLVPLDDQRCRRSDGKEWRCKNLVSTSHNPSYYCDQHYNSDWYKRYKDNRTKKRSKLGPILDSSDDEIELKKQRVETTEKTNHQLKRCCTSEQETQMVKLEKILGVCKRKCIKLLAELDEKAMECIGIQGELDELGSMKIAAEDELKEFKRRQERKRNLHGMVWGEKTSGRITYLEEELKRMEKDMEHEKGEVEFWRNKFFDSEVRVLRMENGSVESRICLPNDAPHSGEKVGDNNLIYRYAEFSGRRHCSPVSELQAKDKVLNEDEVVMHAHRQVKEEVSECPDMSVSSGSPNVFCGGQKAENVNGWVGRVSLEFNENLNHKVGNTAAANSVDLICLDSEDESDSESVDGVIMDRMAMNCRKNVKEVKWESEADMLSSFGKDSELCMKAVCALYRHQTSEEKSTKGLFRNFDAVRIKTLAEFLMDGDCKGEPKKSVKELEEEYTSEALQDCKRLASSYAKQLFRIYKDKQDPFFVLL